VQRFLLLSREAGCRFMADAGSPDLTRMCIAPARLIC